MIVERQVVYVAVYGLDGRSKSTKVFDDYNDALRFTGGDSERILSCSAVRNSGKGRYRKPRPRQKKSA